MNSNLFKGQSDERLSRLEQGISLFHRKQIEECMPYLESVIEQGSTSPRSAAKAHYYIGESQFNLRDYELALFHYDLSIGLFCGDFQVYFDRGYLRQKLRMTQASIDDFTKSIVLNPDFASSYHNRGVAYKQSGLTELAIDDFRRTLQLSLKHQRTKKSLLDLLIPKAQNFMLEERYEDALATLNECVYLDPVPAQVFVDRAHIYTMLGMHADAVDDLTLALQLQPRSPEVLQYRANSLTRLGSVQEAMVDYMRMFDFRPVPAATIGRSPLLHASPMSELRAPLADSFYM
jgi:tetratricopeptide (TPR) repeat protein